MTQLSATQLRRAADLKEKIDRLQTELNHLLGYVVGNGRPEKRPTPKKRKMSAKARARISAAQKARWAKQKTAK